MFKKITSSIYNDIVHTCWKDIKRAGQCVSLGFDLEGSKQSGKLLVQKDTLMYQIVFGTILTPRRDALYLHSVYTYPYVSSL